MPAPLKPVGIVGTGSCLPERVLTNAELEQMVDTSDEWIRTRTGIRERRIASHDTAASDLAVPAAVKALKMAGLPAEAVDLIIVATVTPDTLFPATACLVQERLGARGAAAFDLSAGCSGFIYALAVASQFIATGVYQTALVIGVEILSKIINWRDRNTCVLFGDGAGAVVLQAVLPGEGLLGLHLGADGSGGNLLSIPAGGSRLPASPSTVQSQLHTIHMNGAEVFKFAVRVMGEASLKALKQAGLKKEDVDFLIPHQANIRIIEAATKRLGLVPEKVYVNLDRYGNMSSASIPVALDEAYREGRLRYGDKIVLVAFGAGLTWGAAVLSWSLATPERS
ncbi:3-oxoacyl-[acyl-carrier-protein] synthase 3 [Moorella glycerini]|uniref:Beta-ketoacyl-[acyl-carrier-protein] synthase III n=1 Tax=Neomoorella stamsii TaxID=1266720 RepID=A0A9X7J521_9FIRM|nr:MULTISPECIES: beta-ketoacyl-ACP synthase III [Moorella]PRR76028.1 3-oxoacyl-[acyl-carrier-protein] synthase 3 protein 1 [Moorella stamsii]CEP68366.1 3-oxoacyl-[acyl-carrier-protein] synthase 3 [Moorella glycerini]